MARSQKAAKTASAAPAADAASRDSELPEASPRDFDASLQSHASSQGKAGQGNGSRGSAASVFAKIAGILMLYKALNPESDIKIPEFGTVGLQSSGKTLLLSLLASSFIGGSIQGSAGTRCIIVYIFVKTGESSAKKFEVGTSLDHLEVVQAHQITEKVTAFNNHIRDTEPTGFWNGKFYVRVSGPDVDDRVVYDKAGLLPDPMDPKSECVEEILRSQMNSKDLIPLLMITPQATMDPDYVKAACARIFTACGNQTEALKKSIVVFTQLDNFSRGKSPQDFVALRDAVIWKFKEQLGITFRADRIFFASLKPHYLDANCAIQAKDSDHPEFSYVEANTLLAQAPSFERQHLPAFLETIFGPRLGADLGLQFGILPVFERINEDMFAFIKKNYDSICSSVNKDGTVLLQRAQEKLRPVVNIDAIMNEVEAYVGLNCEGLKAMANADNMLLIRALKNAHSRLAHQVATPAEGIDLVNTIRLPFEDDKEEAEIALGHEISFATSAVVSKIDRGSELFRTLDAPLSASQAVNRLLQMLKFYVMTTELACHKPSYIWDIMQFVNDGRGDASISEGIQRMVESNLQHFPIDDCLAWVTNVYTRMVPRLLNFLADEGVCTLLRDYPRLRSYIDGKLIANYHQFFDNLRDEALRNIELIKTIQFATLGVSKFESLIQLLGSCNLGALKEMVQPQEQPQKVDNVTTAALANAIQENARPMYLSFMISACRDLFSSSTAGNAGSSPSASSISSHGSLLESSIKHSSEIMSRIVRCSPEEFASGEIIKLKAIGSMSEVATNVNAINGAVHCITRLSIGNTVLELVEVVKATIIVPAKQVDDAVRQQMRQVVQHLRENDYRVLKGHLVPDESLLEVLEREISAIDRWLQLAAPLDHLVLADNIRHLTKASQKLHDLLAKEKQRIDAFTQELRQEEAEANPFSGIDSDSDEDKDDSNLAPSAQHQTANADRTPQTSAANRMLAEDAKRRHQTRELQVQLTRYEQTLLIAHRRIAELEADLLRRAHGGGSGSYPLTRTAATAENTANSEFVTGVKKLFHDGVLEGLQVQIATATTDDLLDSLVRLGREHSAVRATLVTQVDKQQAIRQRMDQLEHQYAEAVTQRDHVGNNYRALTKELEKERRQSAEYLRRYGELKA